MILVRALILTLLILPQAQARSPLVSEEQNAAFDSAYQKFSRFNKTQVEHFLTRESSKGETVSTQAQDRVMEPDLWSTLDPKDDLVEGTSTEKIYKAQPIAVDSQKDVVVAVIDGGIDIHHEDLVGKIWVNPLEKGNDEDHDGYLNDVNGWNFIRQLSLTNFEFTREFGRMEKLAATRALTPSETDYFARVKTAYQTKVDETHSQLAFYRTYAPALQVLKAAGLKDESIESLDEINSSDPIVAKAKKIIRPFFQNFEDSNSVQDLIQKNEELLKYAYNKNFNSSLAIGDHADQLDEIGYGDSDVTGPDAGHGTHVAGIIAANRMNNVGILGQAQNVKIMALRAVPSDGDERDKDVGNAIRYAADHGARVINMSFGKPFSPNQDFVRSAAAYAASKGVLMVHAAGNDGLSLEDGITSFPNKKTLDPATLDYWIEVGAADRTNFDQHLAAKFTNFGKFMVDLFAPGVSIVSTVPHNLYSIKSGTSMASPEVSGVAALLLSQFPTVDAKIVRRAILDSVNTYPDLKVIQPSKVPNHDEVVNFDSLSASGGTLNAFKAMNRLYQLTHPTNGSP